MGNELVLDLSECLHTGVTTSTNSQLVGDLAKGCKFHRADDLQIYADCSKNHNWQRLLVLVRRTTLLSHYPTRYWAVLVQHNPKTTKRRRSEETLKRLALILFFLIMEIDFQTNISYNDG